MQLGILCICLFRWFVGFVCYLVCGFRLLLFCLIGWIGLFLFVWRFGFIGSTCLWFVLWLPGFGWEGVWMYCVSSWGWS